VNSDSVKAAKARTLVASLLFLEAGVIFVLAMWLVGLTIFADSYELLPFLGVLLFALLGSAGLAISAIGYRKGKYFGRSPSVLANLIALGVVSYMLQAQLWFVAAALAALALTTLIATLRAIPTDI
jgi:hypothetical protein